MVKLDRPNKTRGDRESIREFRTLIVKVIQNLENKMKAGVKANHY